VQSRIKNLETQATLGTRHGKKIKKMQYHTNPIDLNTDLNYLSTKVLSLYCILDTTSIIQFFHLIEFGKDFR
jgi:hypothetical protein